MWARCLVGDMRYERASMPSSGTRRSASRSAYDASRRPAYHAGGGNSAATSAAISRRYLGVRRARRRSGTGGSGSTATPPPRPILAQRGRTLSTRRRASAPTRICGVSWTVVSVAVRVMISLISRSHLAHISLVLRGGQHVCHLPQVSEVVRCRRLAPSADHLGGKTVLRLAIRLLL